jgi:AbrB family looped-hinge helix DNA binding protein
MRVTQKGQVTIPLEVRRALGIRAGSEVQFKLEADGARLVIDPARATREIELMRGAGRGELSTEEILALTRA